MSTAKFICYEKLSANPLDESLPLFVSQILIIYTLTGFLQLVFFMVRPPRFIPETIAGAILSMLDRTEYIKRRALPEKGRVLIETFGNFGLFLYVFLLGLKLDLTRINRVSKKEVWISMFGVVIPMVIGITSYLLIPMEKGNKSQSVGCLFWGLSLSITSYPVVTEILTHLELLNVEVGRISTSVANINNICAVSLISFLIPVALNINTAPHKVGAVSVFLLLCYLVLRRCPSKKNLRDYHLVSILVGVMLSGCFMDSLGLPALVGGFSLGLLIPHGPLNQGFLTKMEAYVTHSMIPIYLASTGFKAAFSTKGIFYAVVLGASAVIANVIGFMVAGSVFLKMPLRDGVACGIILHTKGVLGFAIINVGLEYKVLTEYEFTILMVALILCSTFVGPALYFYRRPSERKNHVKLSLPFMWCTTMGPRMNRLGERFWTAANSEEFIAKGRM